MMPPAGVAARVKGFVEERQVLAWADLASMMCCIPVGISTFFFLDILVYVRAVNFVTGMSALLAVSCCTGVFQTSCKAHVRDVGA